MNVLTKIEYKDMCVHSLFAAVPEPSLYWQSENVLVSPHNFKRAFAG